MPCRAAGPGAEDIAQEAFLRAYQNWERVGSCEHQAAWVRRVATNLATSGLRRRLLEARALAPPRRPA
jgi:RNA polymerase sigma-70 factor (ECF subfamily)